jgi:hypothetical protein
VLHTLFVWTLLQSSEERHERMLSKLKDGWAAELRRQKEAWAAGERSKRDAWVAAKTQEVKELTVKGLEGEVQKLLSRHKADLEAARRAAAEDTQRAVDMVATQHELALRQLRDKMSKVWGSCVLLYCFVFHTQHAKRLWSALQCSPKNISSSISSSTHLPIHPCICLGT